jgi:hypothetical protein
MKSDHIKRMITLTGDRIKRLSVSFFETKDEDNIVCAKDTKLIAIFAVFPHRNIFEMSWIVLASIIMLNCSKESNPALRKNTITSKSCDNSCAHHSQNGKNPKSIPKTFLSKVKRDEEDLKRIGRETNRF